MQFVTILQTLIEPMYVKSLKSSIHTLFMVIKHYNHLKMVAGEIVYSSPIPTIYTVTIYKTKYLIAFTVM